MLVIVLLSAQLEPLQAALQESLHDDDCRVLTDQKLVYHQALQSRWQ